MSKKLGILMAIICVGLIAFVVWFRFGADKTGPEIKCGNEGLVYHDGMSNSELLKDVTAYDEKDGDVTDSLAVESAYPVSDDKVVVVYVAKDSSNNITKAKQFYDYEGATSPETDMPDINSETEISESSGTDTQIDRSQGEFSTEVGENASDADNVSTEEEQLRKEQEEAAEQMPAGSPQIYLTDYVVKIPVGTSVDRLSYVKEIKDDSDNVYDLWTKIQITGTLDTNTPGTYECTFYVVDSQGNTSNEAVLKFIVE